MYNACTIRCCHFLNTEGPVPMLYKLTISPMLARTPERNVIV